LSRPDEDLQDNVRWYAELRIPEYFVFDRRRLRIRGYRLPPRGNLYEPIVPQAGAYSSGVLGLELGLENERLRFFQGSAPLPEYEELIARLDGLLDQLLTRNEEENHRAAEAEQRWAEETERAEEAERRLMEELLRADEAEQRLHDEARLRTNEAQLRAMEARRADEAEKRLAAVENELAMLRQQRASV
jgi:hypothetical protein